MSAITKLLAIMIKIYLGFCDRYFPLKPGEQGTTREFQSRSFILVFVHTAVVVTMHSINNIMTLGLMKFLRGFVVVDIAVILGFLLIRFYPKAERIAGPYMCLHLFVVACGVAYNGRTPVTGLGLWWPLWVFWTFMIAGSWYGIFVMILAAIGAAVFLFAPLLGTPNDFDFGMTAEGFARFLVIDVSMVSTLGLWVTMLFQHFMASTHSKWLTARNSADMETRYRMLSRFASNIRDRLQPDLARLQELCKDLQRIAFNSKDRELRLAIIAEARQKIGTLASFNRTLLTLISDFQANSTKTLRLDEIISNSQRILHASDIITGMKVVWKVDSSETVRGSISEVLQIFFATMFLLVHEEADLVVGELTIAASDRDFVFSLDGSCPAELHQLIEELCSDCARLLEDLGGTARCVSTVEQGQFTVQVKVPKG